MDCGLANLASFLIRHRNGAMVLQIVVFVACIWAIAGMRPYDDPNAWPPKNDPLRSTQPKISQHFGGGNSVSIEFSVIGRHYLHSGEPQVIKDVMTPSMT